jgi:hypothetical protein
MIEKLNKLRLPVDDLMKRFRESTYPYNDHSCQKCSRNKHVPNVVTLALIKRKTSEAKEYVTKLLEDKERYGYLYYLNGKKMRVPLEVQFNAEFFVDCQEEDDVLKALEAIAARFAQRDTDMFEITKVELLYFFIRLINPRLSWMAVEHMLQCVKDQGHLIASKHRPHSWRYVCDDGQ